MADGGDEVREALDTAQVVETWPTAEPLLRAGAGKLSAALLRTMAQQINASTAESCVLTQLVTAADREYEDVKTSVTDVKEFFDAVATTDRALAPFMTQLEEVEKAVAQLEAVANDLNTQSRYLEVATADLLA